MAQSRNFDVLLDTGEVRQVRGRVSASGTFGVWRVEAHPAYLCRSTGRRVEILKLTYLPTGELVVEVPACVDPAHVVADALLKAADPYADRLEWLVASFMPSFRADYPTFLRHAGIQGAFGGPSGVPLREARQFSDAQARAVAEWISAYRPVLQVRVW